MHESNCSKEEAHAMCHEQVEHNFAILRFFVLGSAPCQLLKALVREGMQNLAATYKQAEKKYQDVITGQAEVDNARTDDYLAFQAVSGVRLNRLESTLGNADVQFAMRVLLVVSEASLMGQDVP